MVHTPATGRHRAPGRYNPLQELGLILGRSTQPVLKGSAVLAASGGLVAAFAMPASATGDHRAPRTSLASVTTRAALSSLPDVTAPAAAAPSAATFGVSEATAVAKPKPRPKPAPSATTSGATTIRVSHARASRSAARGALTSHARHFTSSDAPTGGVLSIAASLSGIYYVYGGTTPAGFDCSGFTSYVFRRVGISLPRTAAQQQAATTRVSDPQPGDLVFFGSPAYHVGIYAGHGMMYDSPRTGKTTGLHEIWSSNVTYGRP